MFTPFFRDPLMSYDPFANQMMDPFAIFENDPFFNPVRRAQRGGQGQQQLTAGTEDMNKDTTALSTGGQQVGAAGNTSLATTGQQGGSNNVGFWNFNRFLNEPLSLGLEDKQDKYVMNVVKPQHIGDHDLKIDINNDVLTVHGDAKQEREDKGEDGKQRSYYYSSSSFSRSIRLPPNVDQSRISANMVEPGKLVIDLPKRTQEEKKSREISINRQGSTGGNSSSRV